MTHDIDKALLQPGLRRLVELVGRPALIVDKVLFRHGRQIKFLRVGIDQE